ncbi:hypothetical protein E1B28_005143 [Marasmius oreades]|uniref:Uncharacterized protein n=1 Tax=Marasmius oreades TaxID=181124 RepID=A0A9P7V002_9AGAR|nr:uncharacterized protein E1B28_005143 [Marasmius oreades]KAG7097825.1 hypothetical protein E1B28_005143 [Marasmius oreades]
MEAVRVIATYAQTLEEQRTTVDTGPRTAIDKRFSLRQFYTHFEVTQSSHVKFRLKMGRLSNFFAPVGNPSHIGNRLAYARCCKRSTPRISLFMTRLSLLTGYLHGSNLVRLESSLAKTRTDGQTGESRE